MLWRCFSKSWRSRLKHSALRAWMLAHGNDERTNKGTEDRTRDGAEDANEKRIEFKRTQLGAAMLHRIPVAAIRASAAVAAALALTAAHAGNQLYEPLSDSVRTALAAALNDRTPPEPKFNSPLDRADWLSQMSERLPRRHKPEYRDRVEFLKTVHYEAKRAGLDPQLVLGLIQVESGFKKYAVSSAGARGYMQVMPFWTKLIGDGDRAKLFDMRSNIRYGCIILRHYLDIEKGDLYMALGRYNGSRGKAEYPNMVLAAWKNRWDYKPATPATSGAISPPTGAGATQK
jgi:soluble lytic murein transglycosylase-like protein